MHSLVGVLLLAAAALPSAAQEHRGTHETARATVHVVSIGVEDYANPALRQMHAQRDARALADSVRALAEGIFAVRIHVLAGSEATRAAVMAVLDSVRTESQLGDVLVLAYRGLGSARFLVLADSAPLPPPPASPGAQPPAAFEARLLRAHVLGAWLASVAARQQLLIIESPDGAAYFHALRELLAAPEGAVRATRDLTALATPGTPTGVLTAAMLESLGEERRLAAVSLGSTLTERVLDKLDAPIVVHQAGAELVLGAAANADARATAAALRDTLPWAACAQECPVLSLLAVENTYTLVGRASGLAADAWVFVNGRRARREGERFEVELPPAALVLPVRVRVVQRNGARAESVLGLP